MNPVEQMDQLSADADNLDKASTRLADRQKEYEGISDGEWAPGPKLRFEALLDEYAEGIYSDYETRGEKIPPVPIREQRARKRIEREDPALFADYHRLKAEIDGLQKWIASKKESVSARQSVLSAEKALAR